MTARRLNAIALREPVCAIKRFLTRPSRPMCRYLILASLAALVPACILYIFAAVVASSFQISRVSDALPQRDGSLLDFAGVVVLAPVVETVLLAWMIFALRKIFSDDLKVAIISGLIWGGLHASVSVMWFFGPAWNFFIFSCCYMAWRKISLGHAFLAAAVPHMLVNTYALLMHFGIQQLSRALDSG